MEYDDVHLLCGKYWIILNGELTEGHAELTAEEKKPRICCFLLLKIHCLIILFCFISYQMNFFLQCSHPKVSMINIVKVSQANSISAEAKRMFLYRICCKWFITHVIWTNIKSLYKSFLYVNLMIWMILKTQKLIENICYIKYCWQISFLILFIKSIMKLTVYHSIRIETTLL